MKKSDFTKIPYIRFIFNDNYSRIYWIVIFIIVFIMSLFNWLIYDNIESFLLILLYIITYIVFYSMSYYNYLKFFRLICFLEKNAVFFEKQYCNIRIISCKIDLTVPKQNFRTKIKIKEYIDLSPSIKTDFSFIFQYFIREYGIFQYYRSPIVVNIDGVLLMYVRRNKLAVVSNENFYMKNNDVIIKLEDGYEIQLLDFKWGKMLYNYDV